MKNGEKNSNHNQTSSTFVKISNSIISIHIKIIIFYTFLLRELFLKMFSNFSFFEGFSSKIITLYDNF